MSKTRIKTHSELEHWKGLVKKLKSENRHLKRKLKVLEKREHFYEDVIEDVSVDNEISEEVCQTCKQGMIIETDLKHIIIRKCNYCGEIERKKPNGETKKEGN